MKRKGQKMADNVEYRGKKFPVNENLNNRNIKVHLLDDELMRKARFTDYKEEYWYYCRDLRPLSHGISFNLAVKKDNPNDWRIDILDEDFCQPYDFQSMLQSEYEGEKFDGTFHRLVNEQVEYEMEHLIRLGVISGWEKGDYI